MRRVLLASFLLAPSLVVVGSRPGADEASRLTEASRAEFHRAEKLAEGWRPVYARGVELAERAIVLDPKSAEAHYVLFLNLGRLSERSARLVQLRNLGRLRELLDRTIELDPRHAPAWDARGEMLLRLPWLLGGSPARAVEALRRAAELDPSWAKPPLRLAQHYWDSAEPEKARRLAERARKLARASAESDLERDAKLLLVEIAAETRLNP